MAQPAPATDPNTASVTIDQNGNVSLSPTDPIVLTNGQSVTITFSATYPTVDDGCDLQIKFKNWKAKAGSGVGDGYTVSVSS